MARRRTRLPFRERSKPRATAFENVDTAADDPAFLNFTSGTTGNPKGALQAHRSMLGHMPGIELGLDFFPQPGDCMWSPADWAWLAGLMDVLMPAWFHGVAGADLPRAALRPGAGVRHDGPPPRPDRLLTPTMLRGDAADSRSG